MRIAFSCAASLLALREMRAGDDDGARGRDESLVHILFRQRHVGAVGAHEDHRRDAFVLDREQHQRRQPLLVGGDALDRHALAHQLLADEAAHLLVADAGEQRRAQAKPRGADRNVSRATTDRLGETRDIFEARADLLAVEVDRGAADGDDVERTRPRMLCSHGILPRLDRGAQVTMFWLPESRN